MRDRNRKEIKAGRYRISYYAGSRGKPLILLHGLLGTSYSFRHVFDTLALTEKVIVPDLIGCGKSSKSLKYDYSLESDADTLMSHENWDDSEHMVACAAIHLGKVRLIDNLVLF